MKYLLIITLFVGLSNQAIDTDECLGVPESISSLRKDNCITKATYVKVGKNGKTKDAACNRHYSIKIEGGDNAKKWHRKADLK